MTVRQHAVRIGLLMIAVAGFLTWITEHEEVTGADGLRYIHHAERLDRGDWSDGLLKAVDHPIHPLALTGFRRLLGGAGPTAWQRAARWETIAAGVLLVIPLYLMALELYGTTAAWLGCLLFLANPMFTNIIVNVLSESTFLVLWTWGLWAALRFLREGRFAWLPLAVGFGGLAYLTRPEGLLLPLALLATVLVSPCLTATRLAWPRSRSAIAFLLLGPLVLVGPFAVAKGGLGTKPSIARLLGTRAPSPTLALERDKPLDPDQTPGETYYLAAQRVVQVIRGAVPLPLLPFAGFVLTLGWPFKKGGRVWVFHATLFLVSVAALVRLHATGGYCTVRHALVPGMLMMLAASEGVSRLANWIVIPGRWWGRSETQVRPGPVLVALAAGGLIVLPMLQTRWVPHGGFQVYRAAGDWIAGHAGSDGKVLDLTDYSLYFSERPGYIFGDVYTAVSDPSTRWVVVRDAHLRGHYHWSDQLKELLAERTPVALLPPHPRRGQLQVRVFDLGNRVDVPQLSRNESEPSTK